MEFAKALNTQLHILVQLELSIHFQAKLPLLVVNHAHQESTVLFLLWMLLLETVIQATIAQEDLFWLRMMKQLQAL